MHWKAAGSSQDPVSCCHGAWTGFLVGILLVSAVVFVPRVAAEKSAENLSVAPAALSKSFAGRLPISDLSEDEAILHALNRLGFGPRPGEIERVRKMGLENWVRQQLHPEKMDDSATARRLERFPTLAMTSGQLLEEFPTPQVAARRAGISVEEYQKQREEMFRNRVRQGMEPGADGRGSTPPSADRMPDSDMRDARMRMDEARSPQRIIAELSMAKLTRAVYSERQLNEVLADFWFNHFNVFAAKGADRWLVTSFEQDAIRPHVLGNFREMLYATAQHPAMLFYLDNWMSADPNTFERMERELSQRRMQFLGLFNERAGLMMGRRGAMAQVGRLGRQMPNDRRDTTGQPGQVPQRQGRFRGLNENYARELMELHTLGVDGGYTQQDVVEVARAFTGWTLRAPRENPEFYFDSRIHDPEPKHVLGNKISAGGMNDGKQVLDLLAQHPSTARFISTKLARRFVADEPPAALVERMAKTLEKSDGNLRAVVETMIYSREFWSRDAYRAKIKKPFELVVSAARATGADVQVPLPLAQWTARIGEPLYLCQPPTGYSGKSEAWVNTGALLNRLNFSLALAGNQLRGARVDLGSLVGREAVADPQSALDAAIQVFLAGQVSPETRATLEKQLAEPETLDSMLDRPVRDRSPAVIAGLVLGSPEFQRR